MLKLTVTERGDVKYRGRHIGAEPIGRPMNLDAQRSRLLPQNDPSFIFYEDGCRVPGAADAYSLGKTTSINRAFSIGALGVISQVTTTLRPVQFYRII